MIIYLDACSLQRPLDDRTQPRINLEAEAVLTILHLVRSQRLELISSEVLVFEISRIPNSYRQLQAFKMLESSGQEIELNGEIEAQAEVFIKSGLRPLDALHLACATWARATHFCTCDDRVLKIGSKLNNVITRVVSPLQLVAEVTP